MIVAGALLAVWSLTGAMKTLMWALNIAFDAPGAARLRPHPRWPPSRCSCAPAWRSCSHSACWCSGRRRAAGSGSALDQRTVVSWVWWTAEWPVLVAALLIAFGGIYRFGPDLDDPSWRLVSARRRHRARGVAGRVRRVCLVRLELRLVQQDVGLARHGHRDADLAVALEPGAARSAPRSTPRSSAPAAASDLTGRSGPRERRPRRGPAPRSRASSPATASRRAARASTPPGSRACRAPARTAASARTPATRRRRLLHAVQVRPVRPGRAPVPPQHRLAPAQPQGGLDERRQPHLDVGVQHAAEPGEVALDEGADHRPGVAGIIAAWCRLLAVRQPASPARRRYDPHDRPVKRGPKAPTAS